MAQKRTNKIMITDMAIEKVPLSQIQGDSRKRIFDATGISSGSIDDF